VQYRAYRDRRKLRPNEDFNAELGPPIIRDSWKNEDRRQSRASITPANISSTTLGGSSLPQPAPLSSNWVSAAPTAAFGCAPLPHLKANPSIVIKSGPTQDKSAAAHTDTEGETQGSNGISSEDISSDTEELGELSLTRGVRKLTIRGLEAAGKRASPSENQLRYHGKSSSYKLVGMTRRLRDKHRAELKKTAGEAEGTGDTSARLEESPIATRDEFWSMPKVSIVFQFCSVESLSMRLCWAQWEVEYDGFQVDSPSSIPGLEEHFPPPDLARNLIDLYFAHVNSMFPMLHRPTFERSWSSGLHQRDIWFACLCMAMFSVASRWSDDPRVLPERSNHSMNGRGNAPKRRWLQAGWKYVDVVLSMF
jgi:hypothetical protein